MPSALPLVDDSFQPAAGTLYVVATPIGNLRDITLRALDVLRTATIVAAEDTRHTGKLLSHYGIRTRLISYHEHNERERTPYLLDRLLAGDSLALVSDAGTPTVSDPGHVLIQEAVEAGIPVTSVPGASSVTASLSISGLPAKEYLFLGFIEKKETARIRILKSLIQEPRTLFFFESPRRILSFIGTLKSILGDRKAVLCRELTKHHEEVIRGPFSHIESELLSKSEIKGEITLLVSGATAEIEMPAEDLREILRTELNSSGVGLSQVARRISEKYGLSKRRVYEEALRIKEKRSSAG